MRMNGMKVMWVTVAALGFAVAACGGGDKDKPAASAEPAKTAEATPPPPPPSAAPSAAPADSAAAAPAPSGDSSAAPADSAAAAEPEDSAHPGKHGKHAKEGAGERAEKIIKFPRAKMEINHPGAGWTESKKGAWTFFRPADKTSILTYVEFEKPGEASKEIAKLDKMLELVDIKWKGSPKKESIGPDHFKAEHAEGTAKVASNKHEAEIEYWTVEGEMLIVYVDEVDVKKAQKHENVAKKQIETLRKISAEDDGSTAGKGAKHHKK
jgi:hypothetical protein